MQSKTIKSLNLAKLEGQKVLICSICSDNREFAIKLNGDIECTHCGNVKGNIASSKHNRSAITQKVAELEAQALWLKKEAGRSVTDRVASFGAWIIDNHEAEINGGEDQIAHLCNEYINYVESLEH
jgi:hypothetical protein